jgi:hypothetical protein
MSKSKKLSYAQACEMITDLADTCGLWEGAR